MIGLLPYGLAAILVLGFWTWDRVTISSLRSEVASLQTQIDDPATGWRRQLSVCQSNRQVFDTAVVSMNAKIDGLGKKYDDVQRAQSRVGAVALADGQKTRDVVMDILRRPVEGVTACDRALVIQREPLP